MNQFLELEEKIVNMLRTVYDPEIPVNIYDLGMIYRIDVADQVEGEEGREVTIQMTLTAPNCPAADFIMEDVTQKVDSVEGVSKTIVQIVFDPVWDQSMMSDEAKLELGLM
ncbi:MAG: iron-sulfur cluster assembly protein [Paludibacteraceae bacterium]|nr:iron-sulfur cluster assembly protein [Paludibacteraceae bacterium]